MEAGGLHPRGPNTEHPLGIAKKEELRTEIKADTDVVHISETLKGTKGDVVRVLLHQQGSVFGHPSSHTCFCLEAGKMCCLAPRGLNTETSHHHPTPTEVSECRPRRRFRYNYNDLRWIRRKECGGGGSRPS